MILEGNQRGGARNLALHLLSEENDHVEVFDVRGFVSDNLVGAFQESYALSRGTKCKQHLFSLSVNPPQGQEVSTQAFLDAIKRVETEFDLVDQPRAIVFHEKKGRRHAHAVWCRIDTKAMRAIPLSRTKRRLTDISRELFIEHNWQMPRGFMSSEERDPANYTLAQWQQAKRVDKDARQIKLAFQDCWAISDSQTAFSATLKGRGYQLARGDNNRFVAVDHLGKVYAIAKWVGIKTKQVRTKLTDLQGLPSVRETRENIAESMSKNIARLQQAQNTVITERQRTLEAKIRAMIAHHRKERQILWKKVDTQTQRAMTKHRQPETSWRGLWQRITGQDRKIIQEQQRQAYELTKTGQARKDWLILKQLQERRLLEIRVQRLNRCQQMRHQILEHDVQRYLEIRNGQREAFRTSNQRQNVFFGSTR